jgi:hypothetical protein
MDKGVLCILSAFLCVIEGVCLTENALALPSSIHRGGPHPSFERQQQRQKHVRPATCFISTVSSCPGPIHSLKCAPLCKGEKGPRQICLSTASSLTLWRDGQRGGGAGGEQRSRDATDWIYHSSISRPWQSHPRPTVLGMASGGVEGDGAQAQKRLVVDPETLDSLFEMAFRGKDGHCTTDEEDEEIDEVAGEYASTYGEITSLGVRQMCDRVGISESDVFLDMGSGVGKAVLQIALERGTRRSIGVELSRSRHRNAGKAVSALSADMHVSFGALPHAVYMPQLL